MQTPQQQTYSVRFRRWTRKAYAAFASLGKVISIGHLKLDMSKSTLLRRFEVMCMVLFPLSGMALELNDSTIIELDELQVEVLREQSFPGISRSISSLSSEEIQQSPALALDDLLKSIPAVDIRQRGIGNTQADIAIRGGSFDQVMILLNGVDITDKQTGHHNLNIPIELADIERIEVLHGSASRQYGSQAFSGAINIITNPKNSPKLQLTAEAGIFNTYNQHLSFGSAKGKFLHFASLSHQSSRGYISNTDYDMYKLFSHLQLNTSKAGQYDFQLGYQYKSFGANGFYSLTYPNQFEHIQSLSSALSWKQKVKNIRFASNIHYRKHYDRFELFRNFENALSFYKDHNYHLTDVVGWNIDAEYQSNIGKFSGGASLRYDHIWSTVLGTKLSDSSQYKFNIFEGKSDKYFDRYAHRFIQTAYVDYAKAIDKLYVSGGISVAHSADFGAQWNGGADISYLPFYGMKLHASLNTASRLPTFTDLYYQSATQLADPNLQPEKSITTEIGADYHYQAFEFQTSAFYRKGTSIIDWVKYPEEEIWKSMNHSTLNTLGSSLSVKYSSKNSFIKSTSIQYSYLHTDKESFGYDSKYALDYLRHQLNFALQHALFRHTHMSWNVVYNDRAGSYTDFSTGNLTKYQPYLLINTKIAWENRGFRIYLDINNLLNTNYMDYGGLVMPGIHGKLGIRWKLDSMRKK